MSDVLSADEVLRLDIDFDPDGDWAKAEESWAALARSHEVLRTKLAAAYDANGRLITEAEAAAGAGGCAADLAESLRAIAISPSKHPENLRAIARMALTKFDRAVSGQTAEKEET